MLIDLDQIVKDYDDRPFLGDDKQPITLRRAIKTACMTPAPGDETLDPVQKFNIGRLGFHAAQGSNDFTAEDIALLKVRTAKVFSSPAFVYAVHTMFEQ